MIEETATVVATEENSVETEKPVPTLEEQQESMRKIAELRARSYSDLVAIHIQQLTRVMLASHGVSELQKRQANTALVEAIKFALDFGIGATNAEIRDKGTVFSKETNTLAGVLVQALDNRMILLADNLRKQQELEAVASQQTTEEQNDTESSGI